MAGLARELDDDLRLAVVWVHQSQVDLVDGAARGARARARCEIDGAAFGHTQTAGAGGGRGEDGRVVFGRDGEAACEGRRAAAGVVDDAEGQRIAVAGFRSAGIGVGEAREPSFYLGGSAGEGGGAQGALAHAGGDGQAVRTGAGDLDAGPGVTDGVFAHGDGLIGRGIVGDGGRHKEISIGGDGLGAYHQRGLNTTRARLQFPIAAQGCSARGVSRGRHIRTRQCRNLLDERLALRALANVAAIEQDVGVCRQVGRPALQLRAVGLQAGVADAVAAQRKAAGRAVAEDLHGFDVVQLGQTLADGL